MKQYIDLCNRIIETGDWIHNKRTGKNVLTVINADLEYDMSESILPILTTKKVAWKPAIAEFLGYLKGYRFASEFRDLGCNTWDANANENKQWLASGYRFAEDDMGRVYGVQFRDWRSKRGSLDQLENIYKDLKQGVDNRREIMTAWNPGEEHLMCLPACIHTHTFSLVNRVLHLTSYQRSADMALGVPFNMVQLGMFLLLMAKITGNKPGKVYHKIVNAHIYEDQLNPLRMQLDRDSFPQPKLHISNRVDCLSNVTMWVTPEHFELEGYKSHPAVKFPFSV